MATNPPLSYRPDIDGLRAVAVLPVLCFHAGLGCPGGYVGVDVFFVISGYLIGSLILREIEAGSFRLVRFWERRIRRLFPALALTLAATAAGACFLFIPTHLEETGEALIAQPLLVANFLFWSKSGYFETASEYQPLLHTWSLAVEEQFYLLLPLLLVPLARRGKKAVVSVTALLFAASLAWSIYGTARHPSAAFFLLPSRVWELGLGLALALFPRPGFGTPLRNTLAAAAGLAAILVPVFLYDEGTPFPGSAALVPCLGAALVIHANPSASGPCGRLLASPLPVWIGKISYPLYLWHWPVLVFARYRWIGAPELPLACGAIALSFLLAWMTWRWVERPVRERRVLARPRPLVAASLACSAAFITIGAIYEETDGFARKGDPGAETVNPSAPPVKGFYSMRNWEQRGGPFLAGSRDEGARKLLLWGDSHAMATLPVLDELGREHRVSIHAAIEPGNAPLFGTRSARIALDGADYGPAVEKLVESGDFDAVLLLARWPVYLEKQGHPSRNYLLTDPDGGAISEEEAARLFVRCLGETVATLEARGTRVHLLRAVAHQPLSVPETVAQARSRGLDPNAFALSLAEHERADAGVNRLLDEALAGTAAVTMDPRPFLTDGQGRYLMAREGRALYSDRSHLSPFGSRQLRPLFEPLFRELSGGSGGR